MSKKSNFTKNKIRALKKELYTANLQKDELLFEFESYKSASEREKQQLKDEITFLNDTLNYNVSHNSNNVKSKILNFLFFGIYLSILPLLFNSLNFYIIGYQITIRDYIKDYILVAFAICTNLCSLISDCGLKRHFYHSMHLISSVLMMFFLCLSSVLTYSISPLINDKKIFTLFLFTTLCIVAVVISGIYIIWRENRLKEVLVKVRRNS